MADDDTASFREEILRYCSPEFQQEEARKKAEAIKEQQERYRQESAKLKSEQAIDGAITLILGLALTGFCALLAGGSIYLLVKFVKWAWLH